MKITGIIAEFNPFHNGHAYLLQKARDLTNADIIVVVMSGDFVQRGTPALLSKYSRAEIALNCGADLVAELPIYSSCASAEYFAEGAVRILADLGVDSLVFGSESGDLEALSRLADILYEEPDAFRRTLRDKLATGATFPAARRAALNTVCPGDAELLDSPNNVLAIEYLKAIRKRNYSMKPYTIMRSGSDYSSEQVESEKNPSAQALRTFFGLTGKPLYYTTINGSPEETEDVKGTLASYVPQKTLDILLREHHKSFPIRPNDFSDVIATKLLQTTQDKLAQYADMNPELAARFFSHRFDCIRTDELITAVKTKELTYARACRALTHFLLEITTEDQEDFRLLEKSPYVRILGLTENARPLLRTISDSEALSLVLKPAQSLRSFDTETANFFSKDLAASELYRQITFTRFGNELPPETRRQIIFVK